MSESIALMVEGLEVCCYLGMARIFIMILGELKAALKITR